MGENKIKRKKVRCQKSRRSWEKYLDAGDFTGVHFPSPLSSSPCVLHGHWASPPSASLGLFGLQSNYSGDVFQH